MNRCAKLVATSEQADMSGLLHMAGAFKNKLTNLQVLELNLMT